MNFASQDPSLCTNLPNLQQILRNEVKSSDSAVSFNIGEVDIEVNAVPTRAKRHIRGGEIETLRNLPSI